MYTYDKGWLDIYFTSIFNKNTGHTLLGLFCKMIRISWERFIAPDRQKVIMAMLAFAKIN